MCLPPKALYSALGALLVSFLSLLFPTALALAAPVQAASVPALNMTLAGVSVVRLQVTYTGTKQPSTTAQCTGLGVIVASWAPEANTTTLNNLILTDGSLVNKNGDATCVSDKRLRPNPGKLASIVVYFSKAYNRVSPITSFTIDHPDVRCNNTDCETSAALFSLHTPYANPYVSLANTSGPTGTIVSTTPSATKTDNTPSAPIADTPMTGIELGKNENDSTPTIDAAIAPVIPLTHPGYTTEQLTGLLTPAAKTSQTQNGEPGMPLVNNVGELSSLHLSQIGSFSATQLTNFVNIQPEIKNQQGATASPVKTNWDKGVKAYIQRDNGAANAAFIQVMKNNPQFQGAKDLATTTATPKPAVQPKGNTFFGIPLPAWLPLSYVWGAIGLVLFLLLGLVLFLVKKVFDQRRVNKQYEEARTLVPDMEKQILTQQQGMKPTQTLPQSPVYANAAPYQDHVMAQQTLVDNMGQQAMAASQRGQAQSPLVDKPTLVEGFGNGYVAPPVQHSPVSVQCPTCRTVLPITTEVCPNCNTLLSPSVSGLHLVPRSPLPPAATVNRGPAGPKMYELEDSTVPLAPAPERNGLSPAGGVPPAPPSYRGQRLGFFAGTRTDPGIKRKHKPNEDNLFAAQGVRSSQNAMQPFGVFVVADGMGGHANGQDASRLAIQTIIDFMLPNLVRNVAVSGDDLQRLLVEGVQRANQAVHKHNMEQRADMGTTMTAALVVDTTAYVANVGDSRTYLYREGVGLMKVTQDHSVVASLVDAGIIKPDDIYTHPKRNQIYRSLGEKPAVEVDSFVKELLPGDKLLLCSDGLWDMVRDPQIENILRHTEPDPNMVGAELINAALNGGGEDNVSVIVVEITEPANKQGLALDVQLIYKPESVSLPHL